MISRLVFCKKRRTIYETPLIYYHCQAANLWKHMFSVVTDRRFNDTGGTIYPDIAMTKRCFCICPGWHLRRQYQNTLVLSATLRNQGTTTIQKTNFSKHNSRVRHINIHIYNDNITNIVIDSIQAYHCLCTTQFTHYHTILPLSHKRLIL